MSIYLVTRYDSIDDSLSAEDILVADIKGVSAAELAEAKREVRDGGTADLIAADGTYYQISPADDC